MKVVFGLIFGAIWIGFVALDAIHSRSLFNRIFDAGIAALLLWFIAAILHQARTKQ